MSTTVLPGLTSFEKIGGQWIFGGASNFSNLLGQWLQELNVEGCHCKFRSGAWRPRAAFHASVLRFED